MFSNTVDNSNNYFKGLVSEIESLNMSIQNQQLEVRKLKEILNDRKERLYNEMLAADIDELKFEEPKCHIQISKQSKRIPLHREDKKRQIQDNLKKICNIDIDENQLEEILRLEIDTEQTEKLKIKKIKTANLF
jgi:hypothetical protein